MVDWDRCAWCRCRCAGGLAAPSVFAGGANVIAVVVLLPEFGMFRQALLRDQVRLYAAQSARSRCSPSSWRRRGTCPSFTCSRRCRRR